MDTIITRFPPSPTGYLHVGGARTALFNWLYARKNGGKFVLRIEDTDTERSTQASVDAIMESLEWLGIDWDEGPYFQTERFDLYKEYIQKLLDSENAYYCTCTPEEIDVMREKAKAKGLKPKYDGRCRERDLKESENSVIRFKAPLVGTTVINDVIKKNIVFQNTELDDFIIERSDKTPTYNLAVVVDDVTMNINTIIRGDDHVNNTPKQIMLYNALGEKLPVFGHVPMVLGKDKSRLSKRHGAMSVTEYRDMGYLPDAMLNYLVRLGWSFGDQEFFTRGDLKEKFNLENIGRSPSVFDTDKLLAINGEHIRASKVKTLSEFMKPGLKEKGFEPDDEHLEKIVKTLSERSRTIHELVDGSLFYLEDELTYCEKGSKKNMKQNVVEGIQTLIEDFEALEDYSQEKIEEVFKGVLEKTGLKFGKLGPAVRIALTGKTNSPGIYEVVEVLGKEATIARLNKGLDFIEARYKEE